MALTDVLDWKLLEAAKPALEEQEKVKAAFKIKNTDRTTGTILSNEITKKYKGAGLPDDTIHFKFTGTAGQSFGAFNTKGVTLELEGDANDYFGKGLSGARLIIYPPKKQLLFRKRISSLVMWHFMALLRAKHLSVEKPVNVSVFEIPVHNVVVEGVGDHGCEYMTGGRVVILGETGRNFAAGMSGGIAYVYDVKGKFAYTIAIQKWLTWIRCNLNDKNELLHA